MNSKNQNKRSMIRKKNVKKLGSKLTKVKKNIIKKLLN